MKKYTNDYLKPDSLLIHGGEEVAGNDSRSVAPPIHMSSSYSFNSIAQAEKVMDFESPDYVYTRGNNPTLRLFEQRMAVLEKADSAIAFSSGMAAISSVLLSLMKQGDCMITHKTVYGSTHTVTANLLPRYGMSAVQADCTNLETLDQAFSSSSRPVKVLFFETPANPTLTLIDIAAVSEIAHRHGAVVVVDNTFATPFLQQPLTKGADIVVHSTTKYICGHGDALGGVAVVKNQDYGFSLKFDYMCELGGVMSPFNAWLMIRGLKTLGLRMDRHCANALQTAKFLSAHPAVSAVYYPSMNEIGRKIMQSNGMDKAGGMISFETTGGIEKAKQVIDSLEMIKIAVSLGDCESLIQLPAAITHKGYDREKLEEFGLSESMIRISVGLEDVDDIIADLDQALKV